MTKQKLREIFWPISWKELTKYIPICLVALVVMVVIGITRNVKNTLLITKGQGLDVWNFSRCILSPIAILVFCWLFIRLANKIDRIKLIKYVFLCFLCFYLVFGTILYPLSDYINFSPDTILKLQNDMPNMQIAWKALGNGTYVLFYVASNVIELAAPVLLWQLINDITSLNEAKRFYVFLIAIIAFFSSIGLAFGFLGVSSRYSQNSFWKMIVVFTVIPGLCIACLRYLFNIIEKKTLEPQRKNDPNSIQNPMLNEKESLKLIFASRYMMLLLLVILSSAVCGHVIDEFFDAQLRANSSNFREFFSFIQSGPIFLCIIHIPIVICAQIVLRKCRWKTVAIFAPVTTFIIAVIFFFNFSPLIYVLLFSLVSVVSGSFYTSSKMIGYIPQNAELKTKGQVIIGLLGTLPPWLHWTTVSGDYSKPLSVEYKISTVAILIVITIFWTILASSFGKEFEKKTEIIKK